MRGSGSDRRLLLAAAAALALACAQPHAAAAQAGSTGGSIGKQGKSVSGGESPPEPRRAAPQPAPARPATSRRSETPRAAEAASPCAGVAGVWTWFVGGDAVFKPNGAVEAVNGLTARWTCRDGIFTVTWVNGFVDRLTLSSDRSRLSGTNNLGFTVTGTRK